MQHAIDKQRYFDGILSTESAVDLIIVDVPEGLHVPTVSAPPAPIPKWNQFSDDWLVPIFDFAQGYLHDNGALLVMYPSPSKPHRSHLLGCYKEYGFNILLDWWGMNHLHLTSPIDPRKTVIAILKAFSLFSFFPTRTSLWSHHLLVADSTLCHLPCGQELWPPD